MLWQRVLLPVEHVRWGSRRHVEMNAFRSPTFLISKRCGLMRRLRMCTWKNPAPFQPLQAEPTTFFACSNLPSPCKTLQVGPQG